MPVLNSAYEDVLRQHWAVSRILGLAICVGAPLTYLVVLVVAVLQGNPRPLLAGFGTVPFRDPLVLVLLFLSLPAIAAPLLVRRLFVPRVKAARTFEEALNLTRTATIIACALLETVAIFGLVAGFLAGPAAAPLSMLMILVTPTAYFGLVPDTEAWRTILEERAWE